MAAQSARGLDPRHFRNVLGAFPTGVVVVTAVDGQGRPAGMAIGSFTSASLDPPMIAFLPDRSSTSFPVVRDAGRFCVNLLGQGQEDLCQRFAVSGGDKFAALEWEPTPITGSPRLPGVVAWIDCELADVYDAGDHHLVLGRVLELAAVDDPLPLLFFRGGYGGFASGGRAECAVGAAALAGESQRSACG